MIKSLDTKVADILANPSGSKAFIIADAKDADMAFGIEAPGQRRGAACGRIRHGLETLAEYREQIRDVFDRGSSISC